MLIVALIMSVTSTAGKAVLAYMPGSAFGPFYGVLLAAATAAAIRIWFSSALGDTPMT